MKFLLVGVCALGVFAGALTVFLLTVPALGDRELYLFTLSGVTQNEPEGNGQKSRRATAAHAIKYPYGRTKRIEAIE